MTAVARVAGSGRVLHRPARISRSRRHSLHAEKKCSHAYLRNVGALAECAVE